MSKYEIQTLRLASVWSMYRLRERIQVDPDYQRQGDVWPPDKRQLLIDTLLNKFDIPKIYLHKSYKPKGIEGGRYDFAIVDGRQRLETMWSFIDGKFPLADDFKYFDNPNVNATSMTYQELATKYPDLKTDFDNFPLDVITIQTDDLELIEEMFSRLNEAVPLTAAEKRNAWPGPVPIAIRSLSGDPFFRKKLPFGNSRYRHYDLATKFLFSVDRGRIMDTKKVYLDQFVLDSAKLPKNKVVKSLLPSRKLIAKMAGIFADKDSLLRSVGMVTLYFHLFRTANSEGWAGEITRQKLAHFEELRLKNREKAEKTPAKADYDLQEFDKYSQSPNDSFALKIRLRILLDKVFGRKVSTDDM